MNQKLKINIPGILLLLTLSLVFLNSTKTLDQQILPRYIALSILISLALVYLIIFRKKTSLSISKETRILLLSLLSFNILGAISILFTINISEGLFILSRIYLFSIIVLLIRISFNNPHIFIKYTTRIIVLTSLIICAFGFMQLITVFIEYGISHSNLYKVSVTFGHKNLFAEYIWLMFPFCAYTMFSEHKIWRVLGMITSLSIIILITVLMTRSVWISAFIATFGCIITCIKLGTFKQLKLKKITLRLSLVLVIVIGTIFIFNSYDSSSAFKKQAQKITNFKYGTVKDRLVLWNKSIEMFKESPLTGKGLASWKVHILRFGNNELRSEDNTTYYQRPHNDYIWILCEVGILGLVSYMIIFLVVVVMVLKLLQSDTDSKLKYFLIAQLFFFISYLSISFFSFPFDRIEHMTLLAINIGIISTQYDAIITSTKIKNRPLQRIFFIGFLMLSLGSLFIGTQRISSEMHLKKAYIHRSNQKWKMVVFEIDKAESFFYSLDPFTTPILWYKGLAYFNLNKHEEAYECFKNSLKYNPNHIYVINDLATSSSLLQKPENSVDLYKTALKIAPNFTDALYNITTLYHRQQEMDSAFKYFSKIECESNSTRYSQYFNIMAKPKAIYLYELVQEEDLKYALQAIINSPEWLINVFQKSKENCYTFEKQMILDAIYILNKDNSINPALKKETILEKYML